MRYALAVLLLLALAVGAHAEYLGEYDVGDTITLHCVLNDNGTAADSVSGDSVKAIIFFEGTRIDTVGLALAGASLPTSAAFYANILADTTVGSYGSWWAVLWAVNVGAGTRDPVGEVSWTLFPRITNETGIVPYVEDVNTVGAIADAGKGQIAIWVADTVWSSPTRVANRRAFAGLVQDSVWSGTRKQATRLNFLGMGSDSVWSGNRKTAVRGTFRSATAESMYVATKAAVLAGRRNLAALIADSVNAQGIDLVDSVTGLRRFAGTGAGPYAARVADSVGAVGLTLGAASLGQVSDTVWERNLDGSSWAGVTAAHNLTNIFRERLAGYYLGDFQQGDSITIGARFNTVDSVYAYIYYNLAAIDTLKLTSTTQGYYGRIMADTTGAGWGSWRALLRGYVTDASVNFPQYVSNSWSLTDQHLYAKEVAESTDVYVHDPDDSTIALVIRDTLNAWADSFKADTVVAVTNDTMHLHIDDWGSLAGRITDSTWAGGENERSLTAAEYGEIGDSVGTNIAALDTIAYVTNVGTVTLVDSARVVRRSLAVTLTDSLVAGQRVREVVLPIDSVIATARVWDLDSARVLATALVVDSARIVASCDSVGKVDTVRAVATAYALVEDSIGKVGWFGRGDSVTATRRNWLTDSTRAANHLEVVERADSVTGVARMVNPLDSVVAVGRTWRADSLRVARRALAVTLADSVTGLRRLNGRVDSVTGVYRVAILDSGTWVGTVDSVGRLERGDTITAVYRTWYGDSTAAVGRVRLTDSTIAGARVWDVDSSRATGTVSALDSIYKVAVVDSAGKVRLVDTLRAGGTVERVTLADSLAAGYRIRFVDDVDSSRALAKVWTADSTGVVARTILTDSTTGAARVKIVDSTGSVGSIPAVDSVTAVARVWTTDSTRALDHGRLISEVTHGDSVTGVARVLLTATTSVATVVDSARVTAGVSGLTTTTIANAVAAKTVGGAANTWGRVLAEIDTNATVAKDSLQSTEISTLAHVGDAMTTTGADKAATADSAWYYTQLDETYPYPSPGYFLWRIQKDSLATIAQIAGAGADSTRAILGASAIQDSLDSLTTRLGRTGDSTLASLAENIRDNLSAVTFPTSALSALKDSVWSAKLDSAGSLKGAWDSSTAAAHLWDSSPKHHGQDYQAIDSATVDTSNVRLGVFHVGGSPLSGTEVYVYTLADSGWSQPIGEDLEPNADGRWWVPVYVPANGDTVYYRVRFHAPGYIDQTKIVRFPQP